MLTYQSYSAKPDSRGIRWSREGKNTLRQSQFVESHLQYPGCKVEYQADRVDNETDTLYPLLNLKL
jgi:hypothetical protein